MADASGLLPGTYTGSVLLTPVLSNPAIAGATTTIPVTLNVSTLPRLVVAETRMAFSVPASGAPAPSIYSCTRSRPSRFRLLRRASLLWLPPALQALRRPST
jgi:hypothetical protein